jgi:hypothetical protein
MMKWISERWTAASWTAIAIGLALFVATFVISYLVVCVVLIKLPENYFHSDYEHHLLPDSHPVLRSVAIAAKNVVGVILILAGIVLSLPGVPGPGLLTIFIGVMLTDLPGKRKLEVKLIGRPAVLGTVNKLRAKYNKPPLQID